MLPASSVIGGNPFPRQDSGANRRCDCDSYRLDALGGGIGSSPVFDRGSSGIFAFLTDAHGSA